MSGVRDDARLYRYINSASKETLTSFRHLFAEHAHLNMHDDHVWFSVLKRPNCSRFSRFQRLTCCLAMLFLAMTSNAMWFDTASETGNPGITIGPLRLTYHTFFVSIMGAAIVVPPTLLMVTLFNRSRKRPQQENFDGNYVASERKQSCLLPWWCNIIGYILVVASVFISSFICILYSLQWGREKSSNWLMSMFLSFTESVVIIHPIKVGLIILCTCYTQASAFNCLKKCA